MIRDVNINFVTLLALIVTLTVHQARCDVQLSFIEDPTCVYLCEKIPAPLNTVIIILFYTYFKFYVLFFSIYKFKAR